MWCSVSLRYLPSTLFTTNNCDSRHLVRRLRYIAPPSSQQVLLVHCLDLAVMHSCSQKNMFHIKSAAALQSLTVSIIEFADIVKRIWQRLISGPGKYVILLATIFSSLNPLEPPVIRNFPFSSHTFFCCSPHLLKSSSCVLTSSISLSTHPLPPGLELVLRPTI